MSLSLNNADYTSLHFIGVLGSGMSAIAQYLQWSGLTITGSDRLINNTNTQRLQNILESIGCRIFPQDGSGISPTTGAVVVSTAIEDSNPDMIKAHSLGLPVFHRSEILAACVNTKNAIAIAGTSGKSTVTALLFHLLAECGKKPSVITGANLHSLVDKGYVGNAFHGNSKLLVIEADESDGSLVHYRPSISLFLNLSKDHKPVPEIRALFETLARQSQHVFCNADDPALNTLQVDDSFGLSKKAGYSPEVYSTDTASVSATINGLTYTFPFPGKHNLYNLCAALQVCAFLHCDPNNLVKAVSTYPGVQRRFDKIKTKRGTVVIDDYAHNPDKIGAALQTVQMLASRVFVLFQPHGFGPTKFLLKEFIDVFNTRLRKNDTLYLLPIYYAGGTVTRDISSHDIADGLVHNAATILTPKNRDDAIPHIAAHAQPEDIVISMGARDPSLPFYAHNIASALDP